ELSGAAAEGHRLLHRLTPQRPPGTTTLTLVCFPHGGGDAIAYQPLAAQLPPHIELLAVSPPGHDPLRPGPMLPVAEFAELAAAEIARTVRGPYAVYGHCAGVVTALETTHVLERLGQRPLALDLAAALPEEDPEYALEMERVSGDDDLVAYLTTMDGFDGVLDDRDLTAVLRMVRHDMTEAARFFARTPAGYDRPLATPLTCIIGDADDATEATGTATAPGPATRPTCGSPSSPVAATTSPSTSPTASPPCSPTCTATEEPCLTSPNGSAACPRDSAPGSWAGCATR
ncbi:hypothetical protein SF23_10860, partial [Streptomyces sp. MBRL 10]